jgi:hypothetical protein
MEKKFQEVPIPSFLLTSTLGCKEHHQGQPLFHNQPHFGNWGTSRSQDCQSPPKKVKKKKKDKSIINTLPVTMCLLLWQFKKKKKRCLKNVLRIYTQQKTQCILSTPFPPTIRERHKAVHA